MKLIVGLGNPGAKYSRTRHNIGFGVVEALARRHSVKVNKIAGSAIMGEGRISGQAVMLMQPTTYMNRSGVAVAWAKQRYKLRPEDILVIYDDLDLPLGKLRLRSGGGAGGHNGIRSILASLGTPEFHRLRIGIDRPPCGDDISDYVLSTFTSGEREQVAQALQLACDAVECWLEQGIDKAGCLFNGRQPDETSGPGK